MVRYHFAQSESQAEVFERLRSIQFDPIAPVGCNHDLVLQARLPNYRVGEWEESAYRDRMVYDGWDKQASLVPFSGWPIRRIFHKLHRRKFDHIFYDHADAVDAVLAELEARGPLVPKQFEFQRRNEEWRSSWHGPSVVKQTLRALWHSGLVMTAGRRGGHHVYDLTERVVPKHHFECPVEEEFVALRDLVLDRHRAVGVLRPTAPYEVWSYDALSGVRKDAIRDLLSSGDLFEVDIEGIRAHVTLEFLSELERPSLEERVAFVAPLDQFMWDRKMILQLFGFDYIWEIYMPEHKRKWGYYVLPVLFGNSIVARVEFWSREGVLEIRRWHYESAEPGPRFYQMLEVALQNFMSYCLATQIRAVSHVDVRIRNVVESIASRGDTIDSRGDA